MTTSPARPRRGRLLPIAVSALIVLWQLGLNSTAAGPLRRYAMTAAMGTCQDVGYFFYFYWHLGVFPVGAAEAPRLGPTRADALAFVHSHGDRLRMDFGLPTNTPRFGDFGKLFTYVPDVWMRHDPADPSAVPFDELIFLAGLLATWWAFWAEGRARLGAMIVALAGSDPFQLYETYFRGNVFSLPISVALLALAANLPLLTGRRTSGARALATAALSALALACVREIRAEAAFVGASVLAVYLLAPRASLARRAVLAAVFVIAWGGAALAWQGYWARQFEAATRFVARAGGQVYGGPRNSHHAFWHAIDCGLGDFGGDRGFAWDDRVAFQWATTRSASNPDPLPYHYRGGYYFEETWDGHNRIAPTDLPAYTTLVRGHVLAEIQRDPAWYVGILLQRLLRQMREATPASLRVGAWHVEIPGAGWLVLPVLAWALLRRRWLEAGLAAFTLPVGAAAMVIYSGRGMTGTAVAHLLALAVLLDAIAAALLARVPARRATGA
jgi:hypothetical protein